MQNDKHFDEDILQFADDTLLLNRRNMAASEWKRRTQMDKINESLALMQKNDDEIDGSIPVLQEFRDSQPYLACLLADPCSQQILGFR